MFKDKTFIASLVLAVIALLAIVTEGFSYVPLVPAKNSAVVKSTINYIKTSFFQDSKVAITSAVFNNGVYLVNFKVDDKTDYKAYISKNGKWIWDSDPIDVKPVATQSTSTATGATSTTTPKTDKPEVKLFTMAFCPYGNQAEYNIIPVVNALKDTVTVEPHYVIYSNYPDNDKTQFKDYCWDATGKYCTMHGTGELHQNVRELCVYKYQPAKYWTFVDSVNTKCTAQDVDTCWKGVASTAGINTAEIDTCFASEATALLAKEVALNTEYGVQGSPMLIINKTAFNGNRTPEAYKTGICSAFTDAKKPAACNTKLSDTDASPSGNAAGSTGDCTTQ